MANVAPSLRVFHDKIELMSKGWNFPKEKKNDNTYNHLYLLSFFIFLLLIVNISSPFAFTLLFFSFYFGVIVLFAMI